MMAETDREEAKQRRAEARRRRREGAQEQAGDAESNEQGDSETPEPLDGVKHAAKVAAAAAAVGAAVGAARALTGNGSDDEAPEPVAEQEQEQEQEPEPEAKSEAEPEPVNEQPQAQERQEERQPKDQPRYDEGQPSGASPDEARRVVASAREQLAALGKDADSVSGLDRNGDGWLVTLEVVELSRIPESTDVLASYELELDRDRKLVRYQRGRRYYRSQADERALT
jgi:hypothetical protein